MTKHTRITVKPLDTIFAEPDPSEAWYERPKDVETLQDEILTTLRQRAHVQRRIEGRMTGIAFRNSTKGE